MACDSSYQLLRSTKCLLMGFARRGSNPLECNILFCTFVGRLLHVLSNQSVFGYLLSGHRDLPNHWSFWIEGQSKRLYSPRVLRLMPLCDQIFTWRIYLEISMKDSSPSIGMVEAHRQSLSSFVQHAFRWSSTIDMASSWRTDMGRSIRNPVHVVLCRNKKDYNPERSPCSFSIDHLIH